MYQSVGKLNVSVWKMLSVTERCLWLMNTVSGVFGL